MLRPTPPRARFFRGFLTRARGPAGATALAFALAGCGSGDVDPPPVSHPTAADLRAPPVGGAAVEAWLLEGAYKTWHCESAIHGPRSPSVHGLARICVNDVVAETPAETTAWPRDAAAVAELYRLATDRAPIGYAVSLKTQDDDASGAGWYFYARVAEDDAKLPHHPDGLVVDSAGDGVANGLCVNCHATAGSDPEHTPSVLGRDLVFTPAP